MIFAVASTVLIAFVGIVLSAIFMATNTLPFPASISIMVVGIVSALFSVYLGIKTHELLNIVSLYIGVNAYGKKYSEANGEVWFFHNLESGQIKEIKRHLKAIADAKEDKLLRCQKESQKEKVLKRYEKIKKDAFICRIFRTQTRYTQVQYHKTPYTGSSTYWEWHYSPEEMEKKLACYNCLTPKQNATD